MLSEKNIVDDLGNLCVYAKKTVEISSGPLRTLRRIEFEWINEFEVCSIDDDFIRARRRLNKQHNFDYNARSHLFTTISQFNSVN